MSESDTQDGSEEEYEYQYPDWAYALGDEEEVDIDRVQRRAEDLEEAFDGDIWLGISALLEKVDSVDRRHMMNFIDIRQPGDEE